MTIEMSDKEMNENLWRIAIIRQRIRRLLFKNKSLRTKQAFFVLKNGVFCILSLDGHVYKTGKFEDVFVKPPEEPLINEEEGELE